MNISEIRITLRDEEKLRAFANITFDNCFVVRGVKVIKGTDRYFVSMPSRKRTDGSHSDIAHPTNATMRRQIEDAVVEAYAKELKALHQQSNNHPVEAPWPDQAAPEGWLNRLKHSG